MWKFGRNFKVVEPECEAGTEQGLIRDGWWWKEISFLATRAVKNEEEVIVSCSVIILKSKPLMTYICNKTVYNVL